MSSSAGEGRGTSGAHVQRPARLAQSGAGVKAQPHLCPQSLQVLDLKQEGLWCHWNEPGPQLEEDHMERHRARPRSSEGAAAGGQAPPSTSRNVCYPSPPGHQATTASWVPEVHIRAAALGGAGRHFPRGEAVPEPCLFSASSSQPGHGGRSGGGDATSSALRPDLARARSTCLRPASPRRQPTLAGLPLQITGACPRLGPWRLWGLSRPPHPASHLQVRGAVSWGFFSLWLRTMGRLTLGSESRKENDNYGNRWKSGSPQSCTPPMAMYLGTRLCLAPKQGVNW